MKPRIVDLPAFKVVGLGIDCKMDDITGIGPLWDKFLPRMKEFSAMEGVYGACFPGSDADSFHYIAGVRVAKPGEIPDGMVARDVPADTYAVFPFEDKAPEMAKLFNRIYSEYLPAAKLTPKMPGICLEDYPEDCWDEKAQTLKCDLYVTLAD